MQEFVVTRKEAGGRFDKYLKRLLPQASSGFVYKMLRKKNITLNDKKAEGKEVLAEKDVVKLFFSEETFLKFSGRIAEPELTGKQEASYGKSYKDSTGICLGKERSKGCAGTCLEEESSKDSKETNLDKSLGKYGKKIYINQNPNRDYHRAFQQFGEIPVVYEDEDILILNKPAGILSQKAKKDDISLNEWMIGYLLRKGEMTEQELLRFRPSVCNRLDRNTSGLLLCGKTLRGSRFLSQILRDRSLHKYYLTYVQGKIEHPIVLNGYLKKDEEKNRSEIISEETYHRIVSAAGGSEGQQKISVLTRKEKCPDILPGKKFPEKSMAAEMESEYQKIETVIKPLSYSTEADCTKLEILLVTGKSHQIRAHLSAIGHPVFGDFKYGWKREHINGGLLKGMDVKYQLLHAYKVEFPETEGEFAYLSGKSVTAPLPELFEKLEERLSRKTGT